MTTSMTERKTTTARKDTGRNTKKETPAQRLVVASKKAKATPRLQHKLCRSVGQATTTWLFATVCAR